MKRFIKTALTVVLAAAAVSCAKEVTPQKENINGTIDLSFTGVINGYTPQEETKAEAQTVVRIMWKGGETVYVFDGTECLGSLTTSIEGTDGTYAKLTGTIEGTTATTLTFVYSPQFSETQAPAVTEGKISLDLSTQNNEEVPFLIYATLPTAQAPTSFSNEVVQFNLATSVFKCNCAGLVGDDDISKAVISGVNTKCELTLSDSGAPEVSGTTPGTITRTETAEPSVFTQADQRAIFSVAVVKTDASAERNILVHQGSKVSGAPFTTATLAGGKSYNTVYQMCEYVPTPPDDALPGGFTINANGDRVYFSKGNLWADATDSNNPVFHFEEHQYDYPEGGYNAENTSHVSYFLWSKDAKQAVQVGVNDIYEYLAYHYTEEEINECHEEHPDDYANILLRQIPDDIFFTNNPNFQVGTAPAGTYSTLTHDEWEYLFNADDNDIRRDKYKCGVKVCGKTNCVVLLPDNWDSDIISLSDFANKSEYNGESNPTWEEMEEGGAVCLPAAGNGDAGYECYPVGEKGSYWSSTIMNDNPVSAYTEFFSDEGIIHGVGYEDSYRYEYSNSVRLVTEASGGYAPKATEVPVESISLSKTELELIEGLSESLTVTFTPAEPTKKAVFWSSDNTAVATVDQTGKVSAVSVGTATITAVADGMAKAFCAVTVTGLPNNVIIYRAAEKLGDFDPDDEDETPGIHTDAFGDNTISGHSYAAGVGTITFENKVTSIEEEAFYECAMTYIGIPASVKEIGSAAFGLCTALEQVFIADGSELETIGEYAFSVSALTSFNIPASVTTIGEGAFLECSNLTKVTFANDCKITSIGLGTFVECGFTSFNIPASVTEIGISAFMSNTLLTSINIPASVTTIGEAAFSGCSNLTKVTFANDCKITSIGDDTFAECGFTSFNIPASVTTIGEGAFMSSALTSINIPSSVTEIGKRAFMYCDKLVTVTFANDSKLTTIHEEAFYESGLESVNIPASVTTIEGHAFGVCEDLATVTFDNNSELITIGNSSFSASGLTSITIPASVTTIGAAAFNCSSLTGVTVYWDEGAKIPSIKGINVFEDSNVSSRTLYVPSGKVDLYTNDNGWGSSTFGTITDGNAD